MLPFYDVVGIGFGPANIALAIAAEELAPDLNIRFLEANAGPSWQADMLLQGADIQNNPLRDLVTPRNPKSHYTFVNFLKETGRLFEHLNLGLKFPLRTEYCQYVAWVAEHFAHQVDYGQSAVKIVPCIEGGEHAGYRVNTAEGKTLFAKSVVLAPGRTPFVPDVFSACEGDRVVHLTRFHSTLKALDEKGASPEKIAVVGSSQSAVEITLALRSRYPSAQIVNVLRNFGFRQKDLSPFTGEVYFPSFSDYYFDCTKAGRATLDRDLRYTNYSAADSDVLDQLYVHLYEDKILGREHTRLIKNSDIVKAEPIQPSGQIALELHNHIDGRQVTEAFDLVICATGFRDLGPLPHQEPYPAIMQSLTGLLQMDEDGCVVIGREYQVAMNAEASEDCPLILNGLCEKTHGMGDAGSFSLLSLRSARIVQHIQSAMNADTPMRRAG